MLCPRKSNILTWLCAFNRSQRAVSPLFSHESNSMFKFSVLLLLPRQFSHLKFVSVVRRSAGLNINEKCANGVLRRYLPLSIFKTQDGVRGKTGSFELWIVCWKFFSSLPMSLLQGRVLTTFSEQPADLRNNEFLPFCRQPKLICNSFWRKNM